MSSLRIRKVLAPALAPPRSAPEGEGDGTGPATPLARRLLLLVAAVALPLLGLAAWTVWSAQEGIRARAERALLERVRTVALAFERDFDRVWTLLDALARSGALARGDLDGFEREMRAASAVFDGAPVTLVAADGTIALSTLWPPGERRFGIRAADAARRAMAEGRAEVTDLFQAPVSGLPSVGVLVPVLALDAEAAGGEGGRRVVAGAVGLSFPRDRVAATLRAAAGLSEADARAGRVAAVLDRSGVSVARTGAEEGIVGRPARPEVMARLALRDEAILGGLATLDGVPAITAFVRGPRSGYHFILTVPEAEFATPLRAGIARTAGLGALVLAAGLGLAAWIARRTVLAFRAAAAAAGEGPAAAATGLREADELARALRAALDERRRAEAALAESEARLRAVFDSGLLGLAIFDATTGRTLAVNDRALRLMDCTREEFLSGARDWRAATPPGHRHLDERAIRQILETGRADPFEKEFLRKDGTRVPVRLTAAPLPGQAGRVVVGIEDLSARREADAALRESEARFRLVAESAPVMLWMGDREGGCVYLNRALRAFWGVAPDAMAGFDWSATLHPEDRDALLAPFGRAMRARIGFTVEARFRRADGEYHVLRAEARPRFGPGGEFLGMIGVNVDVTETRRAEAALREGQARLRDLLATLDLTTVMARDLDGTVRFWSAGCERLYGWTAAEAAGRVAHALLETRFPVPLPEIEAALLRDGEWRGDLRQRRRDGSEVVVSAHKSLRRAAGGRPVAVAESLTDVTALRRAEEQQALLARELDHRAKNALAVVQAAVRLTPKDDPAAFARAVEGRVAALARAHTMLAEGQWRGAALRPLIEAELAAFLPGETVVSDRSAPPRVEVAGPDLALAPVAMQALSMAVHELATNAVKYGGLSASGGRVRVSWHVDGAAGLLRLRWEEAGGPPIAGPPARRGFGSRVLEATVRDQLGGQVERLWGPSGLVCEIAIPVERTVVAVAGRRPGGAAAG